MKSQHWTLRCGPAGNWDVNKSNTLPVPQKHSATRNFEQHVMINCFLFISFLCCAFYFYFQLYSFSLQQKRRFFIKMICFGTASASASYASCVSSIQGCPQVTNLHYLVSQGHCDGTATPSNMAFSEHGPIIKLYTYLFFNKCYDYIWIVIWSLKCTLFYYPKHLWVILFISWAFVL